MKSITDAIIQRFDSDKTLVLFARKIHVGLGTEPVKTLPYVNLSLTGPSAELDTFDADIESYDVEFTMFGQDSTPDSLNRSAKEMMRVFDDCNLVSGDFTTVMFQRTGGVSPFLLLGVYRASLAYEVIVQMVSQVPVVRAN